MRNDDKNIFSINDKEKLEEFIEDKRKKDKEVEESLRKNSERLFKKAKEEIQKGINNSGE
ncbi:hypothetical protein [Bacillus bombysepticus]|uniref:hypothetical protein n=1 Tax=Bacillus bombysepticus TaxID=658666 RepID=UPI00301994EB